nr:probable Xaa-Pro aminopeptidase 3 [Leptinotarsa decemlineata]
MFVIYNKFSKITSFGSLRKFCMKAAKSKVECPFSNRKSVGQPTSETHPHLLSEGEVTPMITKCEYQNRRAGLVESILKYVSRIGLIQKNHMIVIPAASKQYMSDKIPYVFRQNTEFLYLTGCQEPDCCVVITVGEGGSHCTTLFTRDRDEHAELWDGPRTHSTDAVSFFGVDQSLPISELEKFLISYKKSHKDSSLWCDLLTPVQKNIRNLMLEIGHKKWENPKPFLHKLRLYKSPSEIALMQRACDITAQAFMETMSFSRPGIGENQIFAKVDYECRMRGAEYLAYPPVVAGGERSTIIHYINNNQLIHEDEMILMDAGSLPALPSSCVTLFGNGYT